jgi:3-methyladenine DNA glycosylase AlkD
MIAAKIVDQLRPLGTESYRKVLRNHGVNEPLLGVKISDLKVFQRKIKHDYQLALDLYDTGIYDAMYLAGLIADDAQMTKKDLRRWLKNARSLALAEFTVAWVATGSPHGPELAREWIDSSDEWTAVAGWATLNGLVSVKANAELDLPELGRLLQRVKKTIHRSPNHVRYVMNGFVIAVGSYVRELADIARAIGDEIGEVEVDMGDTSCKVPYAPDSIDKARKRGTLDKKRRTVKC